MNTFQNKIFLFMFITTCLVHVNDGVFYSNINNRLDQLPSDIPPDVTRLMLSGNDLPDLDNITQYNSTLTWLSVSGNSRIGPSLHDEAFTGMKLESLFIGHIGYKGANIPKDILFPLSGTLKDLNMHGNRLRNISCVDLDIFTGLRRLVLSNNQITVIGNLSCLHATLEYLDLGFNKDLTYIPIDNLKGLKFLKTLSLKRCSSLTNFPDLTGSASTLESINIENSAIRSMPVEHFAGFTSLIDVNLCRTNIQSIPNLTDSALTLRTLLVQYTQISNITKEKLCPLSELREFQFGPMTMVNPTNLTCLGNLKKLVLHEIQIDIIPSDFFTSFPKLAKFMVWPTGAIKCMEQPRATSQFGINLNTINMFCNCCWSWIKKASLDLGVIGITYPAAEKTPCQLGPPHLMNTKWGHLTQDDFCNATGTSSMAMITSGTLGGQQLSHTKMQNITGYLDLDRSDVPWSISPVSLTMDHGTVYPAHSNKPWSSTTTQLINMSHSFDAFEATSPFLDFVTESSSGFLAWKTWTPWSQCSTSCSGGTRFRLKLHNNDRNANHVHMIRGRQMRIGYSVMVQTCDVIDCPAWSHWSKFTPCSKTCGLGQRGKFRECLKGKCQGETIVTSLCRARDCDTNGEILTQNLDVEGFRMLFTKIELTEADLRPSATALGTVSLLILIVLGVGLIIMDFPNYLHASGLASSSQNKRNEGDKLKKKRLDQSMQVKNLG